MESNSQTETKPCICDICNKSLSSPQYLKQHYASQHDMIYPIQPYDCNLCDKKFFEKCHYEYHMKLHDTKLNKFTCKLCEKTFTTRYYLKSHEEIVHNVNNNVTRFTKIYYCRECNKHFVNKSHKDYHDRMHLNKKELCVVCRKEFCSEQYLKKHVLLKHPNEFAMANGSVVLYNCDLCDRKFVTRCSLERHVQAHNGIKPITCDICGKGLRSKPYFLEIHRPTCLKKLAMKQHSSGAVSAAHKWNLMEELKTTILLQPFGAAISLPDTSNAVSRRSSGTDLTTH